MDKNPAPHIKEQPDQNPRRTSKEKLKDERKIGDVWRCEELRGALRQMAGGPETSSQERKLSYYG